VLTAEFAAFLEQQLALWWEDQAPRAAVATEEEPTSASRSRFRLGFKRVATPELEDRLIRFAANAAALIFAAGFGIRSA
jgi:hypothetical protein